MINVITRVVLILHFGCQNSKPNNIISQPPSTEMATSITLSKPSNPNIVFGDIPNHHLQIISEYSTIQIQENGSFEKSVFIRDTGERVLRSRINTPAASKATRALYKIHDGRQLFVAKPKRALLIGLGGGSMIHYLNAQFPKLTIDAVEIDSKRYQMRQRLFWYPAVTDHTAS